MGVEFTHGEGERVTKYFDSILSFIEHRQSLSKNNIPSRLKVSLNYAVAITLQIILFSVSYHFQHVPEVLTAFIYLIVSILTTLYLGFGPGLISAVLAAFTVNYHYVSRKQIEVSAHTLLFLFAFVLDYGFMVSVFALLNEAVQRQIQAKKMTEDAVFHCEELLQVIAHDLRQPLGAAMMQVELRSRMMSEHPKAQALGDDILKSLKRMDRLVSDVLDSAKSERGKLKLNLEMADLKEVAEQAINIVSENAKRKRVRVSLVADADSNYYCWIDFDRMTRVLINLLGNSLKFTPSEGEITVELIQRDPHTFQVKVRDTGPGIPPEEAVSLFTKNWQNQKTAHLGNGLGLYICKGIIESHFGKIWYEANEITGRGAVFTFSLPKQQVFVSQSNPTSRKLESRRSIPTEYPEYSGD